MKISSTEITNIKVGSTTINKIYKNGVLYWQTGALIPSNPDVLFWLDGTIVDVSGTKYFQDQSSHARNFLITGYDFDSTWVAGFPYKSIATISAPVGDSALIAADINNYLYAANGTPNQIPVTSIFQDIDYVHRLFSRHSDQVLDGNNVETYEPRVSEIVFYSTVKSGSDLTTCQTYFNVPTENGSAKWIDPVNGNDTTGTGTKANPYKTIVATEAKVFSAGTQIYIKTGNEAFATRWTASNNYNWKCLGLTRVSGTIGDVVFLNNANITIEGFYVTCTGRTDGVYFKWQNIVKRCYFYDAGATAYGVNIPSNSLGGTLQYCVFNGVSRAISNIMASLTFNFLGNYCATTCTAGYITGSASSTVTVNFKYNKFLKSSTIFGSFTTFNLFNNQLTGSFLVTAGAYTGVYNIKYNTFTPVATGTCIVSSTPHTERYTYDIEYNTFNVANSYNVQCIRLDDQVAPVIKYNFMNISGTTNTSGGIIVNAISTDCHPANISYNTYSNPSPLAVNPGIQLGNENIGAGDDYLRNSIIEGNKLKMSAAFGNGTNASHAIFITRNTGCSVRYNYVSGASIGIVFKSTNQDNVNALCDYNIIHNCQTPLMAKGITNTKFYNNTTLIDSNIFSTSFIQIIANTQGATGTVFKNNIILDLDDNNPVLSMKELIFVDTASLPGFVSDHNVMYSANNKIARLDNTYYPTFSDWQTAGYDASGLNQNVTFNSVASDIFYPNTPVTNGATLTDGDGLDTTANFTSSPVSIVNKAQSGSWQSGAYVQ